MYILVHIYISWENTNVEAKDSHKAGSALKLYGASVVEELLPLPMHRLPVVIN